MNLLQLHFLMELTTPEKRNRSWSSRGSGLLAGMRRRTRGHCSASSRPLYETQRRRILIRPLSPSRAHFNSVSWSLSNVDVFGPGTLCPRQLRRVGIEPQQYMQYKGNGGRCPLSPLPPFLPSSQRAALTGASELSSPVSCLTTMPILYSAGAPKAARFEGT